MEILSKQFGEDGFWHFRLGGIAADEKWREAAISRTEEPEQWLIDNPTEAQALIDAGEYNPLREAKFDFDDLADKADAEIEWLQTTIPTISDPILKRVAQESLYQLKAWLYAIRRLV